MRGVLLTLLVFLGGLVTPIGFAQVFDSSSSVDANSPLKILRITPSGNDVLAGQELVFQFDRAVVPLGRMERFSEAIPVTITPALACEWRWLNTSALACRLRAEDKMRMATEYRVTMERGIKSENGAMLAESVRHVFTTQRPKITYTRFVNWLSPGTPLIQVTFNQAVTRSSVEQSLMMTSSSNVSAPRLPVIAYPDELERHLPWWLAQSSERDRRHVDDQLAKINGEEARRVWIVEAKGELPLDENAALNVVPGLRSSEGNARGVENRVVVAFDTFPEFKFIGLRCTLKGSRQAINLSVQQLNNSDTRCAPLNPIAFVFSSPVLNSSFKSHVTFDPALDGDREDYDPWENTRDWTRLSSPHRQGRQYQLWLPELLQAYQQYDVSIDLKNLTDEFGRSLVNPEGFQFFTSHREPSLVLNHRYAVLEKGVDSDVPLYVTNLNDFSFNFQSLTANTNRKNQKLTTKVPPVEDVAFALPMGLRELLGDASGAVFGSVRPSPLPPNWYRDPELFAQVTPFQLHVKLGHFSSMVWVSRFDDGSLVENATISLHKGYIHSITTLQAMGYTATTDENGLAALPGLQHIDPHRMLFNRGKNHEGMFAKVELDGDIALMPLNYSFSVRGDVYPYMQRDRGHTHAWGTTAQGVYKLGDTIQFKLYVRDQSNEHWVLPKDQSGYTLKVIDPQSKTVYQKEKVGLNSFGAFDDEFKVPEQGAVGWYQFVLSWTDGKSNHSWMPMRVLVSDFTPSPFKVLTELNGEIFQAEDAVTITSLASLHAGGPYTDADVRITARLSSQAFSPNNPKLKDFNFGGAMANSSSQINLMDINAKLDDKGEHAEVLSLPDANLYFGTLSVESAVRDERGKYVASSARAKYSGRDLFVGLRNTRWLYEAGKKASIEAVVVDPSGAFVEDQAITIKIQRREYKAARVKGPGNAYLTQNIMSWVDEKECKISSGTRVKYCQFTPQQPGLYQFIATIKDRKGRLHSTVNSAWVTGKGYVAWDQSNDSTLQIIPESTTMEVGEKARFLIKNPFPGAKALVSVERYGVIDSWVETLKGSTPVLEIPIAEDYIPGFYLSVVVTSPRVDKPVGLNNIDLGKPSYRMGYLRMEVKDPAKEIKLSVKTKKDVYKPRDKVHATIKVDTRNTQGQDIEIAVAVVDESVLALNRQGQAYYDPYAGFNRFDSLDVMNYSLISRLLGRQKFEKKGANPGGGGGSREAQLRSQFKFVSYWNPAIIPDKKGRAKIEFEVPDNLTGWRILAFAVTPDDRMGLGTVNFKVNRPTELWPIMPNQLIEGDQFKAGFSLMNRSNRQRNVMVELAVQGPLAEGSPTSIDKKVALKPYERTQVWMPITTQGPGSLVFTVSAGDAFDADAVIHQVPVNKRRSLETAANYGTTTQQEFIESVRVPNGIYADVGSIGAVLSPTVLGNLDGAFTYVKDYPHLCWEQRLTKAVFANAFQELNAYLSPTTTWPSPKTDVEKALGAAANFQAANGGMVYWIPKNGYVSPYLSAYTALAFNQLRKSGYAIPAMVEKQLHKYLLRLLRHDEFPSFYSKGMASSVRAVALAALSEVSKVNAEDIARYREHTAEMDLFGKSHFLQASVNILDQDDPTIETSLDMVLGHASQTGGKFQFNESWDDSYKYILATPLRANCAILSSFLSAQMKTDFSKKVGDVPFKLVRSITQSRGNRDHWENTQENVFCLNALIDYANAYEAESPDMQVQVSIDDEIVGATDFKALTDPLVEIKRAIEEEDLGQERHIAINKQGEGRYYFSTRISYDVKEDNAYRINSGIDIRREYSVERGGKFVILQSPMAIARGDLVKVDIFVSVPTARHFVTVIDPIPGGLEPVNTDLATASLVDANKASASMAASSFFYNISDWSYYGRYFWSFYHRELRHDGARFYADYLPAGNYHLAYTSQAIATGEFSVMAVKAEEMYDPDVYGKGLPATLLVEE